MFSFWAMCSATVDFPQPAGPVTSQMWWYLGDGWPSTLAMVLFEVTYPALTGIGFGLPPGNFVGDAMLEIAIAFADDCPLMGVGVS